MASIAIDDRLPDPHEQASGLYESHSEWLLHYCLHQLRDHADAEDAVQIVFLYAFRALRRGVVPECERAWLTTIARNVCHEQRRTRSRRPETSHVELDRIALARPDHEEVGFLDEIRVALRTLPESQRRALLLREWQGLPSSEIAEQLELSEPATHALLFRARRSFVSALEGSRRSVAGLNLAAVFEPLRSLVKALLGGTAVKAAVVTTAAGVVVGGAVLEQRLDTAPPDSSRPAPAIAVETQSSPAPTSVSVARREPRSSDRPSGSDAATPGAVGVRASGPVTAETVPRDPGERFQGPQALPTEAPSAASPPRHDAPGEAAPSPLVPVPSKDDPVPPIDPPPIDVPPIDLPPILGEDPPVELPPPVDELLPPVELPPVDLPPVDLPPVDVPPVPVPRLPLP